ncbi:MAG: DUF4158 domain-containing protein [Hymenobacter sp.]
MRFRGPAAPASHTQLGCAVQLCTLRFLGTFLPDPTQVPAVVVQTRWPSSSTCAPQSWRPYSQRVSTWLRTPGADGGLPGLRPLRGPAGVSAHPLALRPGGHQHRAAQRLVRLGHRAPGGPARRAARRHGAGPPDCAGARAHRPPHLPPARAPG